MLAEEVPTRVIAQGHCRSRKELSVTELETIKALVEEEHELRKSEVPDAARLQHIEEQLDQCWDLLRQRKARHEFGQDESDTNVRDIPTVEGYLQ
jgi:glutamyl-tRNA reductase